jgi:hypothetical protein
MYSDLPRNNNDKNFQSLFEGKLVWVVRGWLALDAVLALASVSARTNTKVRHASLRPPL